MFYNILIYSDFYMLCAFKRSETFLSEDISLTHGEDTEVLTEITLKVSV